MRSPGTIAGVAAVLTCLLIGMGGVDGLVLCLGDDGHMAIEFAQNGKCIACAPSSHGEAPVLRQMAPLSSQSGACHDCADFPLRIEMVAPHSALPSPRGGSVPHPMLVTCGSGGFCPAIPAFAALPRPPWPGAGRSISSLGVILRT